jgi:hypothetical protein
MHGNLVGRTFTGKRSPFRLTLRYPTKTRRSFMPDPSSLASTFLPFPEGKASLLRYEYLFMVMRDCVRCGHRKIRFNWLNWLHWFNSRVSPLAGQWVRGWRREARWWCGAAVLRSKDGAAVLQSCSAAVKQLCYKNSLFSFSLCFHRPLSCSRASLWYCRNTSRYLKGYLV